MTTHETTPPKKQKQLWRRHWLTGVTVAVGLTGAATGGMLAFFQSTETPRDAASPEAIDRVANHQQQHQPSENAATSPADCAPGTLPLVDLAHHPEAHATGGAVSPEAAVHDVLPDAEQVHTYPLADLQDAPVWVVADDETYQARALDDDTWFLTPATFQECVPVEETGLEQLHR